MAGSIRARRRLSLLAGGSLVVAMASATGALVLAPTTALAANECGGVAPTSNGATADVYDCTGSQAAIGYATSGALTLRLNNGVAATTGGVVVTSSGTDAVTISRVDTPVDSGDPQLTSTAGAGVQVTSTGTGAITLNLGDTDTGDTPMAISGATFGVQLTGGATTGAAISLTTTNGSIAATGATGVGVQTTSNSLAAGNTALTLGGSVSGATGVQTTVNGTGTTTITLTATSATVSGGDVSGLAGPAVQMTAGTGAATLTVGAGRVVRANGAANAVVEVANANGARTVNNNGVIRSNDSTATGYDDLAIRIGSGTGAATVTNNAGAALSGRLLLSNSGSASITNAGTWHTADASTLGSGATTLTNNDTGVLATNVGGQATTLDFQGGTDTFANAGLLAVGEGAQGAATLTFTSLEAWNNSGRVLFGANGTNTSSDGVANDRIVAATTFTGSGASTLVMDVDLTGSQSGCSVATIADCLDLRGGTTGGTTSIVVNPVGAGRGLGGRIVLVDVGGGFSADGRFVIDPTSAGYALDGAGDGIIDAGILHYGLLYDATTQQHILLGAPDAEAMEPGMFASFARGTWDLATGTWFDRAVDLRGAGGAAAGTGAWLRVTGSFTDHATTQSFTSGGVTTDYDTSYEQSAVALVGGVDLIRTGGEGGAWVFGLTAGQASADTAFDVSPSSVDLSGYFLGAYTSFMSGPVFVDAIVNAAKLDLTYDTPSFAASSDGTATSVGFQVEGGWRLAVPDMPAHVEPLLALSYVRTGLDDVAVADADASFENTGSLRAGLGLRISGDAAMEGWTTRVSFTGRVWQEFDGESEVTLTNASLDLPLTYDDPSDRLGDIGFTVSALGLGERLSLQVGVKLQFKRDYESRQLTLGARYVW